MLSKSDLQELEETTMMWALSAWGPQSQLLKAAEECTELASALIRVVNNDSNALAITNALEELADVELTLSNVRRVFDGLGLDVSASVNGTKAMKLTRLREKLERLESRKAVG